MSGLLDRLLALHGVVVYAIIGVIVLAEDALFVGFFIPGETAAIIGGVAASRGDTSLVVTVIVVVGAAVVGDTIGFAIGDRYGDRLRDTRVLRKRSDQLDRAGDLLRRRGGMAIVLGRFVAFLRALTPFLAGSTHMGYFRFFGYNLLGGLVWGIAAVMVGFVAGDSYKSVEKILGPVTVGILAVVVIVAVVVWRVRRHRRGRGKS